MNDRESLLRNSLRANCAFSSLSGATFLLGADAIAAAIGLGDARILFGLGVGLLGFAGYLAFVSSRPSLNLSVAAQIIAADLAWVVGTIPVVMLDVLNRTGVIAAVVIADVVLLFALLQYLGVRRIRGGAPADATSLAR